MNKRRFFKKKISESRTAQKGFTLVEVLVVVVIFTFLAMGIYAVALVGERTFQVNKVKIELQQELRKALEWMVNDLRQAGNVSISDVPADGTWYSTITFKTPAGITAGALDWNNNSIQFVRGGPENKELQRIEAGNTRVIAYDMQSLQFRRQAIRPRILEVAMGAQKDALSGEPMSYQLNFSIQLRN